MLGTELLNRGSFWNVTFAQIPAINSDKCEDAIKNVENSADCGERVAPAPWNLFDKVQHEWQKALDPQYA